MTINIQSILTKRANTHRENPTPAEQEFMKLLTKLGIRFQFQSPRWAGNQYRIFDFYLPKPFRLAIEIDGEYHNQAKDKFRDHKLKEQRPRLKVLRFTNQQVLNKDKYLISFLKETSRARPVLPSQTEKAQ